MAFQGSGLGALARAHWLSKATCTCPALLSGDSDLLLSMVLCSALQRESAFWTHWSVSVEFGDFVHSRMGNVRSLV